MNAQSKPRVEDVRLICSCQRATQGGLLSRIHSRGARLRSIVALALSLPLAVSTLGFGGIQTAPVAAATVPLESKNPPALLSLRGDGLENASGVSGTGDLPDSGTPSRSQVERAREDYFQTRVPYGPLIYREAISNGLEPELVAAIIRAESNFQPRLVSERRAVGLMQLIPSTGDAMGVNDLTDPGENVAAGAKYLKYLHAEFNGNEVLALAAYNAGEGSVRRFDGVPPYRETREYVRKVGRIRAQYRQMVFLHAAGAAAPQAAELAR